MDYDVSDRHRSGHTEDAFSFLLVSGKRTVVIFIDNRVLDRTAGDFFRFHSVGRVSSIGCPIYPRPVRRSRQWSFLRRFSTTTRQTRVCFPFRPTAEDPSSPWGGSSPVSAPVRVTPGRRSLSSPRHRSHNSNTLSTCARAAAEFRPVRFVRTRHGARGVSLVAGRKRSAAVDAAVHRTLRRCRRCAAASRSEAERTQLARFVRGAAGLCGFVVRVTVAAVHPSSRGRVTAVHPSSGSRVRSIASCSGVPVQGFSSPVRARHPIAVRTLESGAEWPDECRPLFERVYVRLAPKSRARPTGERELGGGWPWECVPELKFIFVIFNYFVYRLPWTVVSNRFSIVT